MSYPGDRVRGEESEESVTIKTMAPAEVLALPMESNDADAETIRDYLVTLLSVVWDGQEGFSGKRPFGNSGWVHDLYAPLIKAELIESEDDSADWGEPHRRVTHKGAVRASTIINHAIEALR
jgi:hypothetical protein